MHTHMTHSHTPRNYLFVNHSLNVSYKGAVVGGDDDEEGVISAVCMYLDSVKPRCV